MKFREFILDSGTKILAGKTAESNEELIAQVEPEEEVFHTKERGSPFVNIKGKAKKEDIKIASLICARYSHDWRDNKQNVVVHRFKGKDIYKRKGMEAGTFGVKDYKEIKIKKEDIEKFEKKNL